MSPEDKNSASANARPTVPPNLPPNPPAVALHVFSGPHLGARLELGEGTWLLGADDSCDIILGELSPRHAVLEISPGKALGGSSVTLSPLDGNIRLQGEKEVFPPEPGEQTPRLMPEAGGAWYLGRVCFVWNLPGVEQRAPVPETDTQRIPAHELNTEAQNVPSASNEVAAEQDSVAQDRGNILSVSSADALVEAPLPAPVKRTSRLRARFLLLFFSAVILAAMSVALTPPAPQASQYPAIVERYLADAGISGLTVTARAPGVEVRGSVADDAAMLRLRDMARTLHFPVYLEVGVREDILRAVRSSLGIRGFHPEVGMTEDGGLPRLIVAAYIKDAALEAAAFSALKREVRGLPQEERRIVHEKELAPVLEEALKKAGLASVRVIYLPGRVDFAGDFRLEDAPALLAVRQEAGRHFGVPLYGSAVAASPAAALAQTGEADASGMKNAAPAGSVSSGPLRAAAKAAPEEDGDPLGGLRVTGVTMSPMRFVTTADGRRLFEGALLPGGCTLESISTKALTLRRGDRIFTYRLRGSQ